MSQSLCGADCSKCAMNAECRGCAATSGCPFGKQCFIADSITVGGMESFLGLRQKLIDEFNELQIAGMPKVEQLYALAGSFVNLEYTLPNGRKTDFLDNNSIYLGNQLESEAEEGICYGIACSEELLLVCTYGEGGKAPELVMYKKR